MILAIHKTDIKGYFSDRWIEYCKVNNIPYKIVNCYSNTIIQDLNDCDGLMWHFSHAHPIDYQIAINILTSLEAGGKKVFPNVNSCWHFDDKVSQKYLLESINAPIIKSWVYYSKKEALEIMSKISYPKVFKLKGGAGSANVKLIKNKNEADKYVCRAFGRGFRQFDRLTLFKDTFTKFRRREIKIKNLILEFGKIFVKSDYEKVKGNESGYIYFQDFIPNNDSDVRIIVIGDRAFAIKRMVRENDFRASGSGLILYDRKHIDERCVQIAFNTSEKLQSNCLTFDFLFDENNQPLIAEISYGFFQGAYDDCTGYWDKNLKWHDEKFIPQNWMVDDLLAEINLKK
ncbi:ATP-grasp domain-containing protein [Kaistella palustris]|uniref:ATP-grasp domain-containing protein n=1 Tax=Kaistella palustris TaxID=493376 RepID=UPI0004286F54|nr:hypothetical protein [Kaistella palustris]